MAILLLSLEAGSLYKFQVLSINKQHNVLFLHIVFACDQQVWEHCLERDGKYDKLLSMR